MKPVFFFTNRATMQKTYFEKLKDPRWQKKRLRILERDEFYCQICQDNEKTLHVHHLYYDSKYKNPWDYPDGSLLTVCEDCHEIEKTDYKKNIIQLERSLRMSGFLSQDIKVISEAFLNCDILYATEVTASLLKEFLSNKQNLKDIRERYM